MITIPATDDDRVLRNVRLGETGYRLFTWDTYRTDRLGKSILGYAFFQPNQESPLFLGEDFACSPCHAIDSDTALRSLLGFLTLKPGDTDSEYFADYTEEQLAFCDGDAEELSQWSLEMSEDEESFAEWQAYCCFHDVENEP